MLEKIFGSKSRVKLLKIFLLNPDSSFYIRQLSRDLKLQVNSVRRELINLEEFGLISSTNNNINLSDLSNNSELDSSAKKKSDTVELTSGSLKDKKYYKVNKNFILFSEIKSLILKAQILSGENFIKKLKDVCDPKFILLGGMFLNNEGAPTDVLIVANIENHKLLKIIDDLESEMNRSINFTVMDEKEFKYRQEVADVFLHNVLNNKKIILLDKILNV
ncbi:MAG: hypothetical protein WC280_00030 [Patescibacteria group bacterium]